MRFLSLFWHFRAPQGTFFCHGQSVILTSQNNSPYFNPAVFGNRFCTVWQPCSAMKRNDVIDIFTMENMSIQSRLLIGMNFRSAVFSSTYYKMERYSMSYVFLHWCAYAGALATSMK